MELELELELVVDRWSLVCGPNAWRDTQGGYVIRRYWS